MPFIETSDRTSLFYKDWGTGKPVLFLHGWCLGANMWEYQMKPLADRDLRCIAYDVRGCGRSDQPGYGYDLDTLADDLAAVIEHLDLRDATLVGHSAGDRLPTGNVLVVGAGNSGAEISVELPSAGRRVWPSGRDVGRIPFGLGNRFTWWLFSNVLTSDSRLGRKLKESGKGGGTPLIRLTPKDILHAGVERVPRTDGVAGGKPRLEDGRIFEVDAVVWAAGYAPDSAWIKLPIFGKDGYPVHHRGVAEGENGPYFLALPFQHTLTSAPIGGVGADARYVADRLRSRDR